jgi:hypothetical protein
MRYKTLAKRVIKCKGWRWLPGMAYQTSDGVTWRVPDSGLVALEFECLPMLDDPTTLGGLLELVRRAWQDNSLYVHPISRIKGKQWRVGRIGIVPILSDYSSEVEALVSALESAPKISVPA